MPAAVVVAAVAAYAPALSVLSFLPSRALLRWCPEAITRSRIPLHPCPLKSEREAPRRFPCSTQPRIPISTKQHHHSLPSTASRPLQAGTLPSMYWMPKTTWVPCSERPSELVLNNPGSIHRRRWSELRRSHCSTRCSARQGIDSWRRSKGVVMGLRLCS